jgi:methionyl-tRNA formyltransferase
MRLSPVHRAAHDLGLPARQPSSWRTPTASAELAALDPDVLVVADYGFILPAAVIAVPRHGAINVHASALPRWRGAAPVVRAILAGDAATGVTVIAMDAGVDTGPVLGTWAEPLLPFETAGTLEARLAARGAAAAVEILARFAQARAGAMAQVHAMASHAPKLTREETRLDWPDDAAALARRVRALSPAPGAHTWWRGQRLKVMRALASSEPPGATPGEVLATGPGGILVAAGRGALLVRHLQLEGGRALPASAFLAGHDVRVSERLGVS